jgi:hypothetical protein
MGAIQELIITCDQTGCDAMEVERVAMAVLLPGWTEIAYVEDGELRTTLRCPAHTPFD